MKRLVFEPFDGSRDSEVRRLFKEYPHKDFQLQSMKVSKETMADYLETTLLSTDTQTICLKANGKLVGLIALKSLPWMSEHFGLKMYAVSHLLAGLEGPLVRARLLRYVIEELQEVDFLDCRIAVDDVYAAQALESAGFRYVGTEAYLGRELRQDEPFDPLADVEIAECSHAERRQILELVETTHVHNRFACDPLIGTDPASSLYSKLVDNCFDQSQFTALVARSRGAVQGFIISKTNETFCHQVGKKTGSLDFIGVRPDNRNRGLGACLNRVALHIMAQRGVQYVGVRTLANNYPALRITFKTGFVVTSTSLHFHRWIKRPKIEGSYIRFQDNKRKSYGLALSKTVIGAGTEEQPLCPKRAALGTISSEYELFRRLTLLSISPNFAESSDHMLNILLTGGQVAMEELRADYEAALLALEKSRE